MVAFNLFKVATMALMFSGAVAHPRLSDHSMAERKAMVARNTETLGRCLESPELQAINARMVKQRRGELQHLRKSRGIDMKHGYVFDEAARNKWADVNHETSVGSDDPQELFHFNWKDQPATNPAGCILTPETIYGPYRKDGPAGEALQPRRQDIREGQEGIYMRLAMQVIDLNTCKPLWNARVDTWQANSNGEYSNDSNGFLRGWQPTSQYGTVDFDTIFPGHYTGRSTHIHVVVRAEGEDKRVSHTGMLYWDDSIINEVEATEHYRHNPTPIIPNKKDDFSPYSASDKYDPFVRWARSGSRIDDGILSWIVMGVNTTDMSIPQ